ncbi:MAG: pyridoxal-phosphate dependent enzyme [Labilithrix sp.]|nr:pyridoxal-phosphate dependent enzyme [Labilithrix sp.]
MTTSDRLVLGTYPTPIERLESLGLWVKRDDRVASLYGGNKVRKLERLLGAARAAGKSHLLTLGAAGSHQIVATALYGRREGFEVEAVVVPQPSSEHARRNLRVALASGLTPVVAASWPAAPARVAMHLRRDTYFVPLGGSNATGSLGFVDAATEVAAQVAASAMPEPEVVVVAMGSGGTAAGLAVGFEVAGMRTRVVGVAISQPAPILAVMARRVAKKTAERLGLSRAQATGAVERIEVDRRWVGRGYGWPLPEGEAAMRAAAGVGLALDATYTAKAFACALALARERPRGEVLFWHTLSTAPMEALLAGAAELPPDLARLFR